MNELKEKWEALSQRDQLALLAMAFAVVVFLLYAVLYSPIKEKRIKAEVSVAKNTQQLGEVRGLVAQLSNRSAAESSQGQRSVAEEVGASLREINLPFSNMTPSGSSDVRIRFDSANFNNFMTWLNTMENQRGYSVKEVSINETDNEGFVAVNLRLSRR